MQSGNEKERGSGERRSMAELRKKQVGDDKEDKQRYSVDTPRASDSKGPMNRVGQQFGTGNAAEYLSTGDLDGDDDENSALRERREWWVGVSDERREEVEGGLKEIEGVLKGKLGMTEKRVSGLGGNALGHRSRFNWAVVEV